VTEFAQADDGLILELEDYFGVDARGGGLDFSDGIDVGVIDRIFLWSDAYRSGTSTENPVQYVNRWKISILIGDEPVGIAMIGIDPATVDPELIDFIRSPGTALALDDVDTDATLVFEPETGAWVTLSDGVIVPLVRGDSGISGATSLAEYQPVLSSRIVKVDVPSPQPDQGSVQSIVLIATTAIVLVLALLIPTVIARVRERRERESELDGSAVVTDSAAVNASAAATDSTVVSDDSAQEPAADEAKKKPVARKRKAGAAESPAATESSAD